ncbi:MAG: phage tail tape measure protein, partial [Brevundimonas sp.]|nr:phage tail tape measure protein [Brevundimonas sp.]
DVAELDDAELQGHYRDFVKDGFKAAMDGDLKGFATNWVTEWASHGLEDALNSLGDLLKSLFNNLDWGKAGASGGGGGGFNISAIGSTIGSWLTKIPGFATGGEGMVGGSGGIDSKVVSIRATPGELINVRKPGQDRGTGGGSPYFDLRGAVLTRDLLNQMNAIGQAAEDRAHSRAVQDIPSLTESRMAKKQMYSQGRRS